MSVLQQSIIIRQWHIVQFLLKSSGYVSTKDIKTYLNSKQISAEIRTIQRDMVMLEAAFPLECRKDDKPYSWRWQRLENTERFDLTLSQMLVFHQIDTQLRQVLPADLLERLEPLLARSRLTLAMLGQDLDTPLDMKSSTMGNKINETTGPHGLINPYHSPISLLYKWLRQIKSNLIPKQTGKTTPADLMRELPHWQTLASAKDLQDLQIQLSNLGLYPLSQEIHNVLKT